MPSPYAYVICIWHSGSRESSGWLLLFTLVNHHDTFIPFLIPQIDFMLFVLYIFLLFRFYPTNVDFYFLLFNTYISLKMVQNIFQTLYEVDLQGHLF
jgi:hypothetical protein